MLAPDEAERVKRNRNERRRLDALCKRLGLNPVDVLWLGVGYGMYGYERVRLAAIRLAEEKKQKQEEQANG